MQESIIEETKPSLLKKTITTFLCSYFFLYMFPFPFDNIPGLDVVFSFYTDAINALNLWIGKSILGISELTKIEFTGSGDTTFDYVKLITLAVLSIVVTIFLLFIKKEKFHSKFYATTMLYARYYVGLYMIIYGVAKVVGGQFGPPDLYQLERAYGDSTPMNLLWTFMGYSKGYSWFSGFGELIAGIFLLFRRTTAFGSILTIFIMVNVVMLNLCYDVPVKLFSSHLVLISLFIISPDIKNLFGLFMKNKSTTLHYKKFDLPKRWMRITRIILKSILLLLVPVAIILPALMSDQMYDENKYAIVSGTYKIQSFTFKNDSTTAKSFHPLSWRKLILSGGYAQTRTVTDSMTYYTFELDTLKSKINFRSNIDSTKSYSFTYSNLPESKFKLTGFYEKDTVEMIFKKKIASEYTLVKTGFNWINEYPNNR